MGGYLSKDYFSYRLVVFVQLKSAVIQLHTHRTFKYKQISIRKMNSVRYSHINRRGEDTSNMKKSMISTSFTTEVTPGFEDLTNSQIKNLPSHTKVDMVNQVDFIVVFQAIQIQRLSQELESSRIKLRDIQKLNFNCQNYEVQIRELSDRLYTYERSREQYLEENQKMNVICQQLYAELEEFKRKLAGVDFTLNEKYELERNRNKDLQAEIENWRNRVSAVQKSRSKELEDLRMVMESQRKSMLDRELRQLTLKFQNQRSGLQNQIRKLRDTVEYKNQQINQLEQDLQEAEMQIMDLRRAVSAVEEAEKKISMMQQETLRLTDHLNAKKEEIDALRNKEFQLNQRLKDQQRWEVELRQLRTSTESRQRELEDWKVRYNNLEDELAKTREAESINIQLNHEIQDLEFANNKLKGVIEQKITQNEDWKRRAAKLQSEITKLTNLQIQVESYEKKVSTLNNETDRLNMLLKTRLADIEQWKNRCQSLQNELKKAEQLDLENQQLSRKITQQNRAIDQINSQLERSSKEINTLKLSERKLKEVEDSKRILDGQMARLNGLLKNKHQQLQDFRTRYSKLEIALSDFKFTEGKLRQMQARANDMVVEIERLNNTVRSKNDESVKLKNKNSALEEELNFLRSYEIKLVESQKTISSLNSSLQGIRRQNSKWEDKCRTTEVRLGQSERNLQSTLQQKDRLNNSLRTKSYELDQAKNRINKLESENGRLKNIEKEFYELQNKLSMMKSELERADKTIRNAQAEIQREKNTNVELNSKIRSVTSELKEVRDSANTKLREMNELKDRMIGMQNQLRTRQGEGDALNERISGLQSKVDYLMNELERYISILNECDDRVTAQQEQIEKYQDYAKRIAVLSAEIDRLSNQNKGLDEDTKKIRLKFASQLSSDMKHEQMCIMFVVLCAEVESLRSRINDKENHAQEIRRSILEPIKNMRNFK